MNSREDFLASPRAQENAVRAYHKRVWSCIRRAGLDRYAGSMVGQVNITPSGLLAGAHLVGTGKLREFLDSGGRNDPADGFGIPVSEYLRKFAGYDVSEITGERPQRNTGKRENSGGEETGSAAPESGENSMEQNMSGQDNRSGGLARNESVSEQQSGTGGTGAGGGGGNVLINGRTAVHAGSGGVVSSPDPCKAGGKCRTAVFTNTARSSTASGTAGSVFVNGHPICHKDSVFASSTGDEGGNCGGVRSGTIKGKAEFITFSPNVFIEGKPAVRQFDLMVSNNRNTPPMPLMQPGAAVPGGGALEGGGGVEERAPDDEGDVRLAADEVHSVRGLVQAEEEEE